VSRSRFALAVLAIAVLASPCAAAPPGFAFLEVPAGARAAAMGGAYVTLANGADAAFWNPAGLAGVQGTQITGSHAEYIQSLKHDQFAMAGQLWGGGLAGSIRAMYSQPIDARDDVGNLTGTFGSHDLEFQLGYGWQVSPGTRFGIAGQALRERIDNESATTWSSSCGATWKAPIRGVTLGAAALHLGPAAHYHLDEGVDGAPVPLPAALQAGGAWTHALGHGYAMNAALDWRATRGRSVVTGLGAELASDIGAALRAGWRVNDDLTSFSVGAGWRRGTFTVDYAFAPSKLDLGDTHRFSFGAQF
jgi:hypothetical protein